MGSSNWSKSVEAEGQIASPHTLEELADIVANAGQVRPVGAGHSFMPLCETGGCILDLSQLDGKLRIEEGRARAWVPAGWSIARLTEALWRENLSLANQGDINAQSLAGATATGTHGTGMGLGSLSTFVRGAKLVLADGSQVYCSESNNPELFEAARLSLGLLGVVTDLLIDVVPAYGLVETLVVEPADKLLRDFDAMVDGRRHGEFFIFPHADTGFFKSLKQIAPPSDDGASSDFGEAAFAAAVKLGAKWHALVPVSQKLMMRLSKPSSRTGPAFRIFPSERSIRFEEMEYHFPLGAGMKALEEVRRRIINGRWPVTFPFEYRRVQGDDIWLSPFHAPINESVAFHQYAGMPWRDLFKEVEAIFRDHGGRPHWAKRHTLTRSDVDALYPRADDFRARRRSVDPTGKFLNAHLAELFE